MTSTVRRRAIGSAMVATLALAGCSTAAPAPSSQPTPPGSTPAAATPTAPPVAACDGYPQRDIELIIPASPGGGFDTWGRFMATFLGKHLPNDVSVVPVNRPGGGTLLGTTEAYNATPDGYTIVINEPGVIATAQIAGTSELDVTAIRAIARLTVSPELVIIPAQSTLTTVEDVVAASQTAPLRYGHAGLAAAQVVTLDALGIEYVGINHEGSTDVVLAMVRGDVDLSQFTLTSLTDDVEAGSVKPFLIVGTRPGEGEPGFELVADTPTLDEVSGQEGLGAALEQHRILMAPPGTPDCVIGILSDASLAALADADLQPLLEQAGYKAYPKDAADAQAIMDNVLVSLQPYAELLAAALEE